VAPVVEPSASPEFESQYRQTRKKLPAKEEWVAQRVRSPAVNLGDSPGNSSLESTFTRGPLLSLLVAAASPSFRRPECFRLEVVAFCPGSRPTPLQSPSPFRRVSSHVPRPEGKCLRGNCGVSLPVSRTEEEVPPRRLPMRPCEALRSRKLLAAGGRPVLRVQLWRPCPARRHRPRRPYPLPAR
jgi:hypothetical protein